MSASGALSWELRKHSGQPLLRMVSISHSSSCRINVSRQQRESPGISPVDRLPLHVPLPSSAASSSGPQQWSCRRLKFVMSLSLSFEQYPFGLMPLSHPWQPLEWKDAAKHWQAAVSGRVDPGAVDRWQLCLALVPSLLCCCLTSD